MSEIERVLVGFGLFFIAFLAWHYPLAIGLDIVSYRGANPDYTALIRPLAFLFSIPTTLLTMHYSRQRMERLQEQSDSAS